MLVTGSNRFFLNPKETETLVKMVKIGSIVEIEEGEISDTESVEEISEEDFKQEARVLKPKEETTRTTWMGDLLKFPLSNNYASGLHNFAWAQAVQNKPLNEMMMVRDLGSEEKPMRSASKIVANSRGNNSKSSNSSSKEVWNLIIVDSGEENDSKMEDVGCGKDDEKEEGELEEGEIEMDMEVVEENTQEGISNSRDNLLDMSENTQRDLKESEFEKRLNSIKEAIETVTAEEAEKSFHESCSRLLLNLESLQLMVLESRIPNMDALIQQFFTGIQAINSVFGSMNPEQQEHNKDVFSRLLTYVKSQDPALSSPEQIKEIEEMMCSLQSQSISSSIKPMDMEKESTKAMANEVDRRVPNDSGILAENCCDDLNALKKSQLEHVSVKSEDHNKVSMARWTVAAENCCDDLNASKKSQFEPVSVKSKDHNKVSMSRWTVTPGLAFGSLGGLVKEKKSINDSGILAENHCHDLNAPPGLTFGSLGGLVKEKESINDSSILAENECHYLNASKKFELEPVSIEFEDHNNVDTSLGTSRPGLPFSSKSRGVLVPMLDLHRDHDADSLPSPTRATAFPLSIQKPWAISEKTVRSDLATTNVAEKTTPPLPIQKPRAVGDETGRSDLATTKVAEKTEDATTLHLYETDALKAVSTYQQKFGRTSFLSSNRLPSPTPSEECDDGDDDTSGEVSSSFTVGNVRTVNTSIPLQPMGSATPHTDSSSGQVLVPAKTFGQGSALGPILRAPAKSRDPRLRYANSDPGALNLNQRSLSVDYNAPRNEPLEGMMSSRKHKIFEESVLDGHTLKRQRNGLANSVVSRDTQMVSPSGGWLEEKNTMGPQLSNRNHVMGTDPRKLGNGEIGIGKRQDTSSGNFNVTIGGSEQLPVTGTGNTAPLPSLLNDIAVNPTMLMQLIKLEQQRLATEAQQKSCNPAPNIVHSSSSNVTQGVVPLVNVSSSKSSELDQKPASKPQIPSQSNSTNSENERGKIRMKPRDPRRILHSNTFQKSERLGPEQFRTNDALPSSTQDKKDNLIVRQQGEQAETNSLPSQSAPPPDIARQFTKKLKNIADILSASQAVSEPPIDPQVVSSQPMSVKADKLDVRAIGTDVNDQKSGANLMPEESTAVPPRAQNTWGDVEHLFEGYDDQQKAAIQRERTRRIEEQNKMFAARKLCLVLDLDHTLLNSAKFVEVDPVHDEILRKKEEQDKEKPYRHLFRFTHMGMWTKLRPGIWNFLEKASKLFELHLYTMGNKLYATEMAKVIDPTGILFAGRVISKGDDGDPLDSDERLPKTKDLEGVLGMESAVVIVDDSVRVWPHNKLNLIVVERYTYFPCSRRQFGLPGPSLLEIDHDERPEEGTLASSLAVIERIHQIFFSHRSLSEVDVRNILASEQRKILAGCHILFSRVFPLGEANPHLHPLWQTAEQFGGVCTNQIDEQVTHVVANSPGTDKVNWALSTGRFVVHPGWVEASALLYRRANELDFAVKL